MLKQGMTKSEQAQVVVDLDGHVWDLSVGSQGEIIFSPLILNILDKRKCVAK